MFRLPLNSVLCTCTTAGTVYFLNIVINLVLLDWINVFERRSHFVIIVLQGRFSANTFVKLTY